jgi:electron transport complex protein RnfG
MKDFMRLALILFVFCGVAAGLLAFFNQFTKDRIEAQAKAEKAEALRMVFPDATEFRETDPGKRWDALKGTDKAGTVFQISPMGYSGRIEAVCGLDAAGRVTGVRVLSHTETAGLGAKITTAAFQDQFRGKTVDQLSLKKDDAAKGAIDAIAAATISSRAVTRAVRAGASAEGGTK